MLEKVRESPKSMKSVEQMSVINRANPRSSRIRFLPAGEGVFLLVALFMDR
jgi:hypothetical protein